MIHFPTLVPIWTVFSYSPTVCKYGTDGQYVYTCCLQRICQGLDAEGFLILLLLLDSTKIIPFIPTMYYMSYI